MSTSAGPTAFTLLLLFVLMAGVIVKQHIGEKLLLERLEKQDQKHLEITKQLFQEIESLKNERQTMSGSDNTKPLGASSRRSRKRRFAKDSSDIFDCGDETVGGVSRMVCRLDPSVEILQMDAALVVGLLNSICLYGIPSLSVDPLANNCPSGIGSVTLGRQNSASGVSSGVLGGRFNSASGAYSSVSAGTENSASAYCTSVCGGTFVS